MVQPRPTVVIRPQVPRVEPPKEEPEKTLRAPYGGPYAGIVVHSRRAYASQILRAAGRHFGFTHEEMTGASHGVAVVYARHIAAYVTMKHSGLSYPQAGRVFKRDHTTMIHAVRRIQTLLDNGDAKVRDDVEKIRLMTVGIAVEDAPYWGA